MKKINIIDLDNTLIKFDSFSTYILKGLTFKNCIKLFRLLILRKLKKIDSEIFKASIINLYRLNKNYSDMINKLAIELSLKLDKSVLLKIDSYTDDSTINVLSSASPEDYVNILAVSIGWLSLASHFDEDNKFFHNHGYNKIKLLNKFYPKDTCIYNFAISDSETDLQLLKMFNKYILLN